MDGYDASKSMKNRHFAQSPVIQYLESGFLDYYRNSKTDCGLSKMAVKSCVFSSDLDSALTLGAQSTKPDRILPFWGFPSIRIERA